MSRSVNTPEPQDIRLAFDQAADTYDNVRPGYPGPMFDDLFELIVPRPEIVEVGPGTGQATKSLLNRGARVHAIELGPSMAGLLVSQYRSPSLKVTVGDFEKVSIAPRSSDVVFSATAYHWVSRQAQTDLPASILRKGGVVAIVDLTQVSSPDDMGFFAAAKPIYERNQQGRGGPDAPSRDGVEPAICSVLRSDVRFKQVEVRSYDWNQTYDSAQYRKLMLSYSGTQMMSQPDRGPLLDDITHLIRDDYNNLVTRPLVVTLTTAVQMTG